MAQKIIIGAILLAVLFTAIAGANITSFFSLGVQKENTQFAIGALLPLSGKNATYGEEIKNAIELALDETTPPARNKIEVIYEDDASDPVKGVLGAKKLINTDNVPIILGPWASSVVLAIAPIAEENKTIVLSEALAPAITTSGDYIFRIQPQAKYYAEKSAEYLLTKNETTSSILYVNNDYGLALKNEFTKKYEENGGKVLNAETYNQNDSDFRTQLEKIKETNPDALFIAGYQETTDAIKQANELGIETQIVAGPTFESQATLEKLGKLAESVVYPSHYDNSPENKKMQEFIEKYKAKYKIEPGSYAPLMYDGTKIIAQTVEECDRNTECIKEALYKTSYEGIVGQITFDNNGDSITKVIMKTVRNNKFVTN